LHVQEADPLEQADDPLLQFFDEEVHFAVAVPASTTTMAAPRRS